MVTLARRLLWLKVKDWLKNYRPLTIGITGSSGQATAQAAIVQAIGGERRLRKYRQRDTSPRGVALAILGVKQPANKSGWVKLLARSLMRELAEDEPDTVIVQIGAQAPGDIDWIATRRVFKIAVVLNAQPAHLDLFTSREMLAHELTSLVVGLPTDGFAVLNADDTLVAAMAKRTTANVVTYGEHPEAHIRLRRVERLSTGTLSCEVEIDKGLHELHLKYLVNRGHVTHVLAALSVAHLINLDLVKVIKRLQSFQPASGHGRLITGLQEAQLLDESAEATESTMKSALTTLKELKAQRRIAVLGDITHLGATSDKVHRALGQRAAQVANLVILVGESMRAAGEEALKAGADVHHFQTATEAAKWLPSFIRSGDVIIVTGSKDMQMYKVADSLKMD